MQYSGAFGFHIGKLFLIVVEFIRILTFVSFVFLSYRTIWIRIPQEDASEEGSGAILDRDGDISRYIYICVDFFTLDLYLNIG